MDLIAFLFIVCVGGCWLLFRSIANTLFPKEKDPMEYWKNYKAPPVVNNHYHTHVHNHQNLTIIDDETRKKVLDLNK